MSTRFTAIDLSQLPPPDLVEALSFETILAEMVAALQADDPETFAELYPSDPAMKVLETCAYRELLLRHRVNETAKQCMLAYATGSNLDHHGALLGVARLVVDEGDPLAIPPIPPTMESDDAFRARIQLAPEGFSTAGSRGAYRFFALSANGIIKDVGINTPSGGTVEVVVLTRDLDAEGIPTAGVLLDVANALNDEDVRPLNDTVQVIAVTNINYAVTASLTIGAGPDASLVMASAQAAIEQYTRDQHLVGGTVAISGIYHALHQAGVEKVTLTAPTGNVVASDVQAPFCTAITLTQAA
jgi:phage-related baseplate assembly protein